MWQDWSSEEVATERGKGSVVPRGTWPRTVETGSCRGGDERGESDSVRDSNGDRLDSNSGRLDSNGDKEALRVGQRKSTSKKSVSDVTTFTDHAITQVGCGTR